MWDSKKSLMLSRVCTAVFMAALAAALCGGPWLTDWVIYVSAAASAAHRGWFLATLYCGGAAAALLLWRLNGLLANIQRGRLFTAANVSILRQISWCCFAGAGISAASALYFAAWAVAAVAAGFMGIIVRVVKNLVAEALRLKEENDYTI